MLIEFNDLDDGYDYTPGYCLYAMKEALFASQKEIMGAPFGCPYCGTITDERGTNTDNMHIFRPNKKLLDILATYKQLQHIDEFVPNED